MSKNNRSPTGQWLPGESGSPATQLKAGHRWRFAKGVSGNPNGYSKGQAEFMRLQAEALRNPVLLKKALAKLELAIDRDEPWALSWYLAKVWPDRPALVNVGVSVNAGENVDAIFEAFYSRISSAAARIEADGNPRDAAGGAAGTDGAPLGLLGPPEST
jgi:hypothetical protein